MRRVRPLESRPVFRLEVPAVAGSRSLVGATSLELESGALATSGCLACTDEPCRRFATDEVKRAARVETPAAPDEAVCPVDALSRDDDGVMVVDAAPCFGCGLCAVRCPVGAIWIKEEVGAAVVERPGSHYKSEYLDESIFAELRTKLKQCLNAEAPPFADASIVSKQVEWAEAALGDQLGQRAFRLMVRNAFLLSGSASRLKIQGDNNAFAELVVDDGAWLAVVEIEPGGDLLDALRRALAGSAISISRCGADPSELLQAIVVSRLPNYRVDYYEVVRNFQTRLGVVTCTIPLAVLLLGIRSGGLGVAELIEAACDKLGDGSVDGLEAKFGSIGDAVAAGLAPAK